jgi:hypothetical protein
LERLSARQIQEWIAFKTIEAEDKRTAYENAAKPKAGNVDAGDED